MFAFGNSFLCSFTAGQTIFNFLFLILFLLVFIDMNVQSSGSDVHVRDEG